MRRRWILSFVVAALAAAPAQAADTWSVDKVHSEVGFQVRHFVSKVRGRFSDFSGSIVADRARPEASSVEFTIKTASIDTGNEGRDKHLRSADFFDADKNPEISFRSSRVKAVGEDRYAVTGTLIMHGVSREITLPVTSTGVVALKDREGREQAKAGFEAELTLDRKDFGIVWNRALDSGGTVLGDEVRITINLETNRQAPAAD